MNLKQLLIEEDLLQKTYITKEEAEAKNITSYEFINEYQTEVKFYKNEKNTYGVHKVYLNEKFDLENLPDGVFYEQEESFISYKKYYNYEYDDNLSVEEKIKTIKNIYAIKFYKTGKLFFTVALILSFILILLGLAALFSL